MIDAEGHRRVWVSKTCAFGAGEPALWLRRAFAAPPEGLTSVPRTRACDISFKESNTHLLDSVDTCTYLHADTCVCT